MEGEHHPVYTANIRGQEAGCQHIYKSKPSGWGLIINSFALFLSLDYCKNTDFNISGRCNDGGIQLGVE